MGGSAGGIFTDLWVNDVVFAKADGFFHSSTQINRGEQNFASAPLQPDFFYVVVGCSVEYGSMSLRSNPN